MNTPQQPAATERRSWQSILLNRKMLICVALGFTSGMPLYLLIQLVPAWMRNAGVDLATIGLFSLMTLPYTWKFLWAPLMDRYVPPFLGRRRGWALGTQVALLLLIAALGHFQPDQSVTVVAALVFCIAFASASQDVVVDAYRRELLDDDEMGTGTSIFVNAYRLSGLIPGSLALILSDHLPWASVFWITGAFMGVGIITSLVIPEMSDARLAPRTLREAVVDPFREFFSRRGFSFGLAILAFMFLYKLGDNMAVALATPFYIDLGFSNSEIGSVAKAAGLWASIAGSVLAGVVMLRYSINKALWMFGVVQIVSILGFAWLAQVGDSRWLLFLVVSFEYLGVGLGSVALIAFMSRETNKAFTATQFALFSSFVSLPRVLATASTGFIVEAVGWTQFFFLCTLIAVPGMLMLLWVAPWNGDTEPAARK